MTRRAFHRALVVAGMDTWPFWETVMMCSLVDMSPLYATRHSLYDRSRPIIRYGAPHGKIATDLDSNRFGMECRFERFSPGLRDLRGRARLFPPDLFLPDEDCLR